MAEMSTGGKVAVGVGITLLLTGVGVGLYFVLRKPKSNAPNLPNVPSQSPLTLADLQKQNPQMSNADLLKALSSLLKGGSKPSLGGGSGSGGSTGGTKPQPKPTGSTQTGGGGGYDYSANDATYNQDRDQAAYYDAVYGLGGYGDEIPSDWSQYESYAGNSGSYGGGY